MKVPLSKTLILYTESFFCSFFRVRYIIYLLRFIMIDPWVVHLVPQLRTARPH